MYKNQELLNVLLYNTKEHENFKQYLIDLNLLDINRLIIYLKDNLYLEHKSDKAIYIFQYFIENGFEINYLTMTKYDYTILYRKDISIRIDEEYIKIEENNNTI
jgi:hypothetical protein